MRRPVRRITPKRHRREGGKAMEGRREV